MTQEEYNRRIARGDSFLLASDGEFLGLLSTNKYNRESICNTYGTYGSRYGAKSIWNEYGQYGSQYSLLSPNNPYSLHPPQIILRGRNIGFLTCNEYKLGRIIDTNNLIQWMNNNGL